MFSFKSIYFVIFVLNLHETKGHISDKRLCANADCTEPVSFAKTLLTYSSPDPDILSFTPNQDVQVFSKEAGSETRLWGGVINGKRGYFPKEFVREYKMLTNATFLVDTENSKTSNTVEIKPEEKIESQKVQEPYEVIDGTTLYTEAGNIFPSTTESPVIATAVPSVEKQDAAKTETLTENSNQPPQGTNNIVDNLLSTVSSILEESSDNDDGELEDDEYDEEEDEEDEDETIQQIEDIQPNNPSSASANNNQNKIIDETQQTSKEESVSPQEKGSQPVASPPQDLKTKPEENKGDHAPIAPPQGEIKKEEINRPEVSEEPTTIILDKKQDLLNNKKEDLMVTQTPDVENIKTTSTPEVDVKAPSTPKIEIKAAAASEAVVETEASKNVESKNEVKAAEQSVSTESILSTLLSSTETKKAEVNPLEESISEKPKETLLEEAAIPHVKKEEISPTEDSKINEGVNVKPEVIEDIQPQVLSLSTSTQPSLDEEASYLGLDEVTPDPLSQESIQEDKQADPVPSSLPPFGLGLFGNIQTENIPKVEEVAEAGDTKAEGVPLSNEAEENINIEENLKLERETLANGNMDTAEFSDISQNIDNNDNQEVVEEKVGNDEQEKNVEETEGFLSNVLSLFGSSGDEKQENIIEQDIEDAASKLEDIEKIPLEATENVWLQTHNDIDKIPEALEESCDTNLEDRFRKSPKVEEGIEEQSFPDYIFFSFNSDVFLYLVTTAVSVIIFLFGYVTIDKSKREGPLVARINKLEQQLLVAAKENELLQENEATEISQTIEVVNNEQIEELTQRLAETQLAKAALEEQISALEKELDTSTEVGMELNRIVSEMLNSTNGSDTLKASVEQMQRQLLEQQNTITTINETLRLKEMESHELHLELEISNKKVVDLQGEVDKMVEKVLRIEEERDQQQSVLEREITTLEQKFMDVVARDEALNNEIQMLRTQLLEAQRETELKTKEYKVLKDSLRDVKAIGKNNDALKNLLNVSEVKAQLEQLKTDNKRFAEQLQIEIQTKHLAEKQFENALKEVDIFKEKYELADKEKVEINTKLEVLNNYFKEKEAQLQKEIGKYESMWKTKEGEAVSTTEQIRYMEERLEIYKQQNDGLKEEIVNQEVELKSQISMLEKKVHENWVINRQLERKLEDARQEAAQLRNKLTMREMSSFSESSNAQNRLQSPSLQNGEHHPLAAARDNDPASPPPLFPGRLTASPPLPPPHFLPPPPGAPFLPPPPLPFAPPPPPPTLAAAAAFPGDRRPPPLGRMSSPPPPPLSRFTPNSEYSYGGARSPSPGYASESDYAYGGGAYGGARARGRLNGRAKGSTSGSDPLNDSLADKKSQKHSNMV